MPAPTASTAPDRADLRSRLLVAQFWVGIALAPIAALLLIFGGTTAAAVLAIIAVVVLALSVMLRSDPTSVSASASGPRDVTVDDMNALRDDVRADITTAARATHRALSEKMARLEDSVAGVHRLDESLIGMRRLEESIAGVQRQVEAARAVAIEARDAVDNRRELPLPLPPPRRPAAVVGSVPGVVRHTETVVTRSMYVDQPSDDVDPARPSGSTVYGSASRSARSVADRAIDGVVNPSATYSSDGRRSAVSSAREPSPDIPEVRQRPWEDSPAHDRRDWEPRTAGPQDRWADSPRESRSEPRRESRPESDPESDPESRQESRQESRPESRRESRPESRRREASVDRDGSDDRYARNNGYVNPEREDTDHREESWTEQRLRAYLPRSRDSLERVTGRVVGEPTDSSGDLANDARWSRMRDGDRWAEVRADDRGRELRMAERREERRVDETGTQLRIVDRWSSVREERIPPGDGGADRETRAQRRRRTERDDSPETYPVEAAQPALPRPRSDTGGGRDRPDDVGRGWRDVRSGVVEPDHAPRYDHAPRFDHANRYDHASGSSAASGGVSAYDARAHDDIGIYRRSQDNGARRRDSGDFPPARGRDAHDSGEYAPTQGRDSGQFAPARGRDTRDSGDVTPARGRDSGDVTPARGWDARDNGDFPAQRRAEPDSYEDWDDRWVREPGRYPTGRRPQLDFEATDDRWQ
jgi:hypothetical protein